MELPFPFSSIKRILEMSFISFCEMHIVQKVFLIVLTLFWAVYEN